MSRALVIEHDHASPVGPIGERLVERGYDLVHDLVVPPDRYDSPGVEHTFGDLTAYDVVLLLGAPWSTYADSIAGWVGPESIALRAADAAGVPVLGICFGGQLLAQTHGGGVTLSERPEVGWSQVRSDADEVVPGGAWFQWHYDRWSLPPGARELARNDAASQAFVLRRNLAVQFHPEITPAGLDAWLSTGFAETEPDLPDLATLAEQVAEHESTNRVRAHALVDGFLDHVATG